MYKEEFTGAIILEETGQLLPDYELERNKPMPNIIHGALQARLAFLLMFVYEADFLFLSELSLASEPPTTPDLCVVPKRQLDVKTAEAKTKEAPLTTIEIISPTQSLNELMHKAWDIYFPMGVLSAWIVIPEFKSIQIVLPNDEKHYFDKGVLTDPATGIQLDVDKLFSVLL